MNKQLSATTVKRLIELNNDFYNKVAGPFTKTRSYSWAGWQRLADYFAEISFTPQRILDLGCGNGRFLTFVLQNWQYQDYTGIDANTKLLEYAQESYGDLPNCKFITLDFLTNPDLSLVKSQFDLIVLLGVMHHVPGEALRKQILTSASEKLSDKGFLIVTFWDFLSEKQLSKKIVPWSMLDINEADLAERDYLLDWKRDNYAFRYCHYYVKEEIVELAKAAKLEVVTEFFADGPGGRANRYVVFKKV